MKGRYYSGELLHILISTLLIYNCTDVFFSKLTRYLTVQGRLLILFLKESMNNRYDVLISVILFSGKVFFMLENRTRRSGKVIYQVKYTVTDSSHLNQVLYGQFVRRLVMLALRNFLSELS